MVVQHNISAMTANRYYTNNNSALAKSMEKLSSGLAINRAGDNAAGLAVSEKMRAQISGLTQASKNAQDGISMVQTFEGALQETDSILQRMRTLAVQSANGSYANEVDRDAIQLEFDQLNDELNQIADTDYNGVVVLNGGTMADGVEADEDTGKIDYSKKAEQLQTKLAELDAQKAAVAVPQAHTASVDDVAYTQDAANKVWENLNLDVSETDNINVTFTADADGNFTATKLTTTDSEGNTTEITKDKDGNDIDLSKLTASNVTRASSTGDGGFKISTTGANNFANLVFDATEVKEGDVVGITLKNIDNKSYAPKNIGFTDDSANALDGKCSSKGDAKIELDSALTDSTMTAGWKDVLDKLSATNVTATYTTAATPGATALTATLTIGDSTNFNIAADGTITTKVAIGDVAANTTVGKFTADTEVKQLSSYTTAGSVAATYGIKIENYAAADPTKVPDASSYAAEPDTSAADAQKAEIDAQKAELLGETSVGVSNSYGQGQRNLTYAKDMTLQTGARSKDSVKFTFKYDSDGLGNGADKLEANMNCSAREGGLNTASLSLKTQQEANDAIDKIDNAINKVSMVRATFGAIQNRLEHKISNLDTNAENMTAAESRIRDTQMDQEMMKFTSAQILSQASQSMLAQANSLPQGVLQLLG